MCENDFILGIAGKIARESFDFSGERRTWDEAGGQAMLVGVAAGALFASARAGTGAFVGIAPTGRTSPNLGGLRTREKLGVDTYRIHKMMAAAVMTGHKGRIALVKPRQLAVCCCSGATWVAKEQP